MEKKPQKDQTILIKENPTIKHQDQEGKPLSEIKQKMSIKDISILSKLTHELQLPPAYKRDSKHLIIWDIQRDFSLKKLIVMNRGSRVEDLSDGRIYHKKLYPKRAGEIDNRHYRFWMPNKIFSPSLQTIKNGFNEQFWTQTMIFWYGSKNPLVVEENFEHDRITDEELVRHYNDGVKAEVQEERAANKSAGYISYIAYIFLGFIGVMILMTLLG